MPVVEGSDWSGEVGREWLQDHRRCQLRLRLLQRQHEDALQAADVDEVVVTAASRGLDGVISFDVGQDVADPNSFVAVEVFEDRAALDRQEALEAVEETIKLLGEIAASEPEATIFHVSSSEPWG
jgi:quinol monooxygenase YgiN